MKLGMKGGFSVPIGETWIKLDIDIELDDKEIQQPKLYNVEAKAAKGIKIINGLLETHIAKQLEDVKRMVSDAS